MAYGYSQLGQGEHLAHDDDVHAVDVVCLRCEHVVKCVLHRRFMFNIDDGTIVNY